MTIVDSRTAGATGDLPEGLTFVHGGPDDLPEEYPFSCHPGEYEIRAQIDGRAIGQIRWLTQVNPNANVTIGHITFAGVKGEYHRRGVATEMLRRAKEVDPRVHHSHTLTDDGLAWSQKTGSQDLTGYTFEYVPTTKPDSEIGQASVRATFDGERVGVLSWFVGNKMINNVYVKPKHQRKGVASEMLRLARQHDPEVRHNTALSMDGYRWSQAVGSKQPGIFYHVTPYKNWPSIRAEGLKPFQGRVWLFTTSERAMRYQDGYGVPVCIVVVKSDRPTLTDDGLPGAYVADEIPAQEIYDVIRPDDLHHYAKTAAKPPNASEQWLDAELEMRDSGHFQKNQNFYDSISRIIRQHGKRWDRVSKTLPPGLKRGKLGECYKNAANAALSNPNLIYCEGLATGGFFPMGHAWVVDGEGTVYDPTWPIDGKDYYGIPFDTNWLRRYIVRSGYYSVLGTDFMHEGLSEIITKGLPSAAINATGSKTAFRLTPQQEQAIMRLRQDVVEAGETNSKGGPSCGVTSEELAQMLGGSETYGAYRTDKGDAPEHAWVNMPDGTIVDATGDQFGNPAIQVIPLSDPRASRYLDSDGDDYGPKTASSLSLEAVISVAEETMARGNLTGKKWGRIPQTSEFPEKVWDPGYIAAVRPITDFIHQVLREAGVQGDHIRFYRSSWKMENAIAATDGMNSITVRDEYVDTLTLLHECAHIIRRTNEGSGHDEAFVETVTGLYRKYISPAAAEQFQSIVSMVTKTAADYWGGHRPTEDGPPAYDLLDGEMMPDDAYDHPEYYTSFRDKLPALMKTLRGIRGNPEADVAIYRSLPVGVTSINNGDWVSLDKEYAQSNNLDPEDPSKDLPVISAIVKAKYVRYAGDDLMEWGYFGPTATGRIVSHGMGAAGDLPSDIRFLTSVDQRATGRESPGITWVYAFSDSWSNTRPIGVLGFHHTFKAGPMGHRIGEVYSIAVNEHNRRKGIGTALLEQARKIEPRVHHSHALTPDGRAWSQHASSKTASGQTFWRCHDPSRPFSAEDATSTPFGLSKDHEMTTEGYSCMDDPWQLWAYWATNIGYWVKNDDVIAFSGKPVGRVGHEYLATPDMQSVKRYSWKQFEQMLLDLPRPPEPLVSGMVSSWEAAASGHLQNNPSSLPALRIKEEMQKAKTASKTPPATLHHFTSTMHLTHILNSGRLTRTESNIHMSGAGPRVVWLTTTDSAAGNGLTMGFKDAVKITVRPPANTFHWPTWSFEQGIEGTWYDALASSSEGDPENWWVCTDEIGLDSIEKIEVNGSIFDFKKTALPSWRDRGERPEADYLIVPDLGRARGNSYSLYVKGQPHARRPSLAEIKEIAEKDFAVTGWTKVEGDKAAHFDKVWGLTKMFNDAPYFLVGQAAGQVLGGLVNLPAGYEMRYKKERDSSIVGVVHEDKVVGSLSWVHEREVWGGERQSDGSIKSVLIKRPPQITNLKVDLDHRRKGLATAMYAEAMGHEPDLVHDDIILPDGEAWMNSLSSSASVSKTQFGLLSAELRLDEAWEEWEEAITEGGVEDTIPALIDWLEARDYRHEAKTALVGPSAPERITGQWVHANGSPEPLTLRNPTGTGTGNGYTRTYYGPGLYLAHTDKPFIGDRTHLHTFEVNVSRAQRVPKLGGSADENIGFILMSCCPKDIIDRQEKVHGVDLHDCEDNGFTDKWWRFWNACLDEARVQALIVGPPGDPGEWISVRDPSCLREISSTKVAARKTARFGLGLLARNWQDKDRDDIKPNPDGTVTLYRYESKDEGFDFDNPPSVGVHWTTWPQDFGYNVYPGDRVQWVCHAKPSDFFNVADKFHEYEVVLKPGSTVKMVGRTFRKGRVTIPAGIHDPETKMNKQVKIEGRPILPEPYRTPGHDLSVPAGWPS